MLVGKASVMAGKCLALRPRLAASFPVQRPPGADWPCDGACMGGRSGLSSSSRTLWSRRVTASAPMTSNHGSCGSPSCASWARMMSVASLVITQLLSLQFENNKKPIHMYINSPGGMKTACLAIYDTMQYILNPICTVVRGSGRQHGLPAACCRQPRHVSLAPQLLHHDPPALRGCQGQATDIAIQAEEIMKLKKQLYNIYAKHTKQSLQVIESAMEQTATGAQWMPSSLASLTRFWSVPTQEGEDEPELVQKQPAASPTDPSVPQAPESQSSPLWGSAKAWASQTPRLPPLTSHCLLGLEQPLEELWMRGAMTGRTHCEEEHKLTPSQFPTMGNTEDPTSDEKDPVFRSSRHLSGKMLLTHHDMVMTKSFPPRGMRCFWGKDCQEERNEKHDGIHQKTKFSEDDSAVTVNWWPALIGLCCKGLESGVETH
ncbi:ATP-dependent Clp protease proteolytic subunit, mitochondrial [Sciurus carolinensis]|uniref:ATP-dependent Clp protease proteolytic subunit, mitochondrial n=1 Tax=Sciurus carolinensis TaxID=30640 RepID=A0AA41SYS4_SCICA|nr:ATP-dependent Clp protease proteolytic subunit, mitochondrial [Sciurus carolinensis]